MSIRFAAPLMAGLLSIATHPDCHGAEIWTSKDGRTIEGSGVLCGFDHVQIKRSTDGKTIELPFDILSPADVQRATRTLPIKLGGDVRISAKTVSSSRATLERETGRYAVYVDFFSYGGSGISGVGTISPITEKFHKSTKIVEIELSSLSSPEGLCGIEFYVVAGMGPRKRIASTQRGVYSFNKLGNKIRLATPQLESLAGWVVVSRSLGSGEITGVRGSQRFLEEFVRREIPKVVEFKGDQRKYLTKLLTERK